MENQVHYLVDKINSICSCGSCGGRVSNYTCNYCGSSLSGEQISEVESATKKLLECIGDYSFEKTGYRDFTIYELYRLSDLKIDIVDSIIEKSDYEKKLEDVISCIIYHNADSQTGNISSLEKLSADGFNPYDMLLYFCCEKDISRFKAFEKMSNEDKYKLQFRSSLFLFRKIYNKEYNPNNDGMLKELYCKIAYMYARTYGLYVSSDFRDLSEKLKGLCNKGYIMLSNSIVGDPPDEVLNIIFHEFIHASQNYTLKVRKTLYEGGLMSVKDALLEKRLGRKYYEDNYALSFDEQEAYILSPVLTCEFLESIKVEPSKNFLEESKKTADYFSKFVGKSSRIYAGVLIEQDLLFDNFVHLSSKDLDEYPLLHFEYKEEDGKVMKKTLSDLESDYNNYLNGSLKWNGDHEMICSMYEKRIVAMKENTSPTY